MAPPITLNKKDFSCWVLTENLAGTRNQCIGVANALDIAPSIIDVQLKEPWKSFSPHLGFEQSWSYAPKLEGPWPDLLLTCGRKSIAAARFIKKTSGGKTFSVHIQDPKTSAKDFDLIAAAQHDRLRGDNVIVTTAAPNRITPEKLEQARAAFPQFGDLPGPRIAVLIGGKSKAYDMSANTMRNLCAQLKSIDGSLMITASRRTGEGNEQILREGLKDANAYIWDGEGENPYLSLLAWADTILVTADSASMLSDAGTTGKPVYIIPLEGGGKRINALHQNLVNAHVARMFEGALESWSYRPLNDAQAIATEIKQRLNAQD